MSERKQPNRLATALLKTADDMRRAGVLTATAHEKLALRHPTGKAGATPCRDLGTVRRPV